MIQTIDIQELGWKHSATILDGGTKTFKKETSQGVFIITSHADNHIYKMDGNIRFPEIKIEKFDLEQFKKDQKFIFTTLYYGMPKDKEELKSIIAKLNIDLKETRKEKLKIINSLY